MVQTQCTQTSSSAQILSPGSIKDDINYKRCLIGDILFLSIDIKLQKYYQIYDTEVKLKAIEEFKMLLTFTF